MTRTITNTAAILAVLASTAFAQAKGSSMSDQEKEQFLLTAKLESKRPVGVGVNNTLRLTLTEDGFTHDAHFSDVDEYHATFQTPRGTELNFRDAYRYNVAAYRLDRMLGLNMLPVTVTRKVAGHTGSVSWWIDDVQMMDKDRREKGLQSPNPQKWNNEMYQVRVFNELVYNTDANLGNLLITNDWDIRLVDYTRAFRLNKDLRAPQNLVRIDRRVYEGLQRLNEKDMREQLGDYLMKDEIKALLARRDKIVETFDKLIAEKGEAAVFCDASSN